MTPRRSNSSGTLPSRPIHRTVPRDTLTVGPRGDRISLRSHISLAETFVFQGPALGTFRNQLYRAIRFDGG